MKRRVLAALAVANLTVAGLVGVSTPAAAASGDPGWVYAGTPIYVCPSRVCTYDRVTQYDAWIPLECWQDSGTPWERWFKVLANPRWIQAFRVENSQQHPQPSLPHC
ncbi:hypothetical protein ACGFI9_36005 [Micromonospora sp. NPDC048930]|uniref:hypothetical protein n=1 Tax=Micromonospora sp. NPDC048930 TaxID=3364261 RepID=UPI00370FCB9A